MTRLGVKHAATVVDPVRVIPAVLGGLFLLAVLRRLLGRVRHRRSGFQNSSETRVRSALKAAFPAPDYHLFNHVTLRFGSGTTQIDHILVSRHGVAVIETKDYRGWIFAEAHWSHWTQVLYRAKFRFQNPLVQNARHVEAVRLVLDGLPPRHLLAAVVFTGDAEFRTGVPSGVFDLPGLVEHLARESAQPMSWDRMYWCIGRLESHRLEVTAQTDVEHVESLRRRLWWQR